MHKTPDGKDMNVLSKTPEDVKKGIIEAIEEVSWVVEDGDPYDLQYACDKAHASMADALALIQQFEEALLLMVYQYCSEDDSYVSHRWMTAGEHAFAALGIENFCSIETISKRLDEMEDIHKTPLPEPPKE